MKTKSPSLLTLIGAVLGLLCFHSDALAQNSLIAIGQINGIDGSIVETATTFGPAATANGGKVAVGFYTITIDAPGGFPGALTADFLVELTIVGNPSGDDSAKATIQQVDPNQLIIRIHTDDLEDPTNVNQAKAQNQSCYFAIYRIPSVFPDLGATKFLHALGKVGTSGFLLSAPGVGLLMVGAILGGLAHSEVKLCS